MIWEEQSAAMQMCNRYVFWVTALTVNVASLSALLPCFRNRHQACHSIRCQGVPRDLIAPGVPPQLPQSPDADSPPEVDPSILTPQVRCHIPEGSIGLDR